MHHFAVAVRITSCHAIPLVQLSILLGVSASGWKKTSLKEAVAEGVVEPASTLQRLPLIME